MSDIYENDTAQEGKRKKSLLHKNDLLTLEITDMNNLGYGIGHAPDGMTVFVGGVVSGDKVEAKIIKIASHYAIARLEALLEASCFRAMEGDTRYNFCSASSSCGGCCYRYIKYSYEKEIKREYVRNSFKRAGLPDVEVKETVSNGIISGYRNKAQYPVRRVNGKTVAGFFANGTHRIIPCNRCTLLPNVFSDIVKFIVEFIDRKRISAYDEENESGILRHICLRTGQATGEIMVCLVINRENMPYDKELADLLISKFPSIVSVMININMKNTNVILGDRTYCVGGREYMEDILCGIRLRVSAESFYQVNRDMAELLYGIVRDKCNPDKNTIIADLYCGTGSIGLSMAKDAELVIGVEIVPRAVECACQNAKLNGIENASFFCGDATDTNGLLKDALAFLEGRIPDVAIIDPPRKGSTTELIDYLDYLGIKKVVYVSCAPDTLARDCAYFAKKGYNIGEVTPVDLFPGTGHVESVVLMSR